MLHILFKYFQFTNHHHLITHQPFDEFIALERLENIVPTVPEYEIITTDFETVNANTDFEPELCTDLK